MSKNELGELVLKAKGERSYREYQQDSGIDASIIHRIVKGTYIPKNADMYKKLTKGNPNGVTVEDLVSAAKESSEYKQGVKAGMAATQSVLAIAGAVPLAMISGIPLAVGGTIAAGGALAAKAIKSATSNKKQNPDKVEKYLNDIRRFSAVSNGILFSQLAEKGIVFNQDTDKDSRLFENEVDTYLNIDNQKYSSYLIRYLFLEGSQNENDWLIKNISKTLLEELMLSEANKERKVSIVTESKKAYEYLKTFEDSVSYKGNLSIIFIDTKRVKLEDEVVISTYDETINKKDLMIV